MESILALLGFKKQLEVQKAPMTNPINPVGKPISLATYTHAKTTNKLKVYFSDDVVIGVWNDRGKGNWPLGSQ